MQRFLAFLKLVFFFVIVVLVWTLATGLFVFLVEVFSPGNWLAQTIGTLVSLALAAFVVRRGYLRIWRSAPAAGRKAPRKARRKQKRAAKRRRGLDELYDESFGDAAGTVGEAGPGYRVLADDLPRSRTWKGDATVKVGGLTLERPLAYVSKRAREACPGTICLGATVAKSGEVFDEALDYWPRYSDLSPRGRRGFLLWLAGGARAATVSVPYAFLYFYGLEQRAVGDGQDLARIRDEVLRLHDLYGGGRSFHGYACALVGMTHVRDEESDPGPTLERLATASGAKLPVAFLRMLSTSWPGGRWPAPYVLEVLRHHGSNTVVQKRAWEQFATLFHQRFDAAHPDGFAPRKNAKRRRGIYRWAANTGTVHADFPYLEPTALGKQWTALLELWAEVTAELKPFAVAAGRTALSEGERYQHLPPELRTGEHPEERTWQEWFDGAADEEELLLTTWGALAELSPSIATKQGKVTPKEARDAATLGDAFGLAMEPDPRAGRGRSRPLDEPLLVYRPAAGRPAAPDEYHDALALMVELCVGVAEADGQVTDDEIEEIIAHVDRRDTLGAPERERLLACVAFHHRAGAGLTRATKARLGKLPVEVREALAHLVVLVALADGVVTDGEEKALRKVYRALDLPPAELDEVLVPHRPAPEVEEAEDEAPAPTARVAIDWERVSAITADTRDVQALLHQALAAADAAEEADVDPAPEPELAPTPGAETANEPAPGRAPPPAVDVAGLDARAAPLLSWIKSLSTDTIPAADWDARCKEHGLMADMAVDMINEWADEALDDYLVEDGGDGSYTLNRELL